MLHKHRTHSGKSVARQFHRVTIRVYLQKLRWHSMLNKEAPWNAAFTHANLVFAEGALGREGEITQNDRCDFIYLFTRIQMISVTFIYSSAYVWE